MCMLSTILHRSYSLNKHLIIKFTYDICMYLWLFLYILCIYISRTYTGLQLLISKYQIILQSLPMDYENTLNLLQNYLTDDQICQILSSSNYSTANKIILDCLIEKFKESVNIPELCKKLELIASLSTSKQLSSIVNELKEG